MKTIYAFCGKAGAGKDTSARMLAFLNKHIIVNGEDYQTYLENDYSNKENLCIYHFSDSLKSIISILFNIPVWMINDRHYKDEMFLNLNNNQFVSPEEIGLKDMIINIEKLQANGLRKELDSCQIIDFNPLIKIRTLLQYIGTDVIRAEINEHIWTNIIINKIDSMLHNVNQCYIADLRFKEEYDSLQKYCNKNKVKLVVINIYRPNNINDINSNHISEMGDFLYNVYIENDGTLEDLFNKIKNIYHENC